MVQKVAIDKDEWDRLDKGGKPKRKPKVEMPKYDAPIVEKHIKFDNIPLTELEGFTHDLKVVTNKEGVRFVGFNVTLTLKDKDGKPRKPLRGWMSEADVLKLQQYRRS